MIDTNSIQSTASSAKQNRSYRAILKNTAGFNFSHELSGNFLWGSGKVGKYTYDATLYGPLYGKSDKTKATRLDKSVVEISSTGKFRALKYAPVEYSTHIVVRLYGSGTYSVIKATMG